MPTRPTGPDGLLASGALRRARLQVVVEVVLLLEPLPLLLMSSPPSMPPHVRLRLEQRLKVVGRGRQGTECVESLREDLDVVSRTTHLCRGDAGTTDGDLRVPNIRDCSAVINERRA